MKTKKKATKFDVGTRVVRKFSRAEVMQAFAFEDDVDRGTVVGEELRDGKSRVLVSWKGYNDPVAVESSELILEAKANKQIAVLEKEFNKLTKGIEVKMKAASKAILEAHKVANKLGLDDMSYLTAVSPLMDAMEEVGYGRGWLADLLIELLTTLHNE
jgi:hypothetical protein